MKEYRICETCDYKNHVSFLECEECGADISFISPSFVEERNERNVGSEHNNETEYNSEEKNDSPKEVINRGTVVLNTISLVNQEDGKAIIIPPEGGWLGREGNIDASYFVQNPYVSGKHLKIHTISSGVYAIIDEKSTNGTRLNGTKIEKGKEYIIRDGDVLTIANCKFVVEV